MIVNLKIKHKLFSALFLTSVMVATGLFFFLQWNFDRGFLNYVNSQELVQLELLKNKLADLYGQHSNWHFMEENHGQWQQLHSEVRMRQRGGMQGFDAPSPPPPPPGPKAPRMPGLRSTPAPPEGPGQIGPRIVLLTADKNRVIGGPATLDKRMTLHPIRYQQRVVGYLGVVPVRQVSDAGDLLFVEQQTVSFAIVTGVMLLLSLLVSFYITSHLLRPINQLITGTRKLISGWFSTRIPVTTGDELGMLSEHFNKLAMTLEENENIRQQWVADISHELRTPLAILQGEVEAMQDGILETDAHNLAALHGEILHLGRLVNDLYELSMTDIGALNYKKIPLNPIALLLETGELFEQRFQQQGLQLRILPKDSYPVTMLADPDRLQQLFTNILENSLRYTSSPGMVEVHIAVNLQAISFSFIDSAPGVSKEELPHLFDRLFRADKSRNREYGGAGLGMAICKNIVEAHQGKIEATQSLSGGLQIDITLPQTA